MSVTQRGTSWQATVNYRGERFRRQFQTRQEADIWEAEATLLVRRGQRPDEGKQANAREGKPTTLKALRDYTQENRWDKNKSAHTATINSTDVVRRLGEALDPNKVDRARIDKMIRGLEKDGNAPATINRKMAALSTMLKVGKELGVVKEVPTFHFLRETGYRRFRLTQDLEASILGWFTQSGNDLMAAYVILSLDTGGRQNEVLRLRWVDVQDGRTVSFHDRKSGRSMGVPMTHRVQATLERLRDISGGEMVFRGLTQDAVQWAWRRMREALGFADEPAFVPHILRHEFCSRLADAGVAAPAIMALADHSNMSTTQRYINMSNAGLRGAIDTLNRHTSNRADCGVDLPHTSEPRATRRETTRQFSNELSYLEAAE